MRQNGLNLVRTCKINRTTDNDEAFNIVPSQLQENCAASGPNKKWACDITVTQTNGATPATSEARRLGQRKHGFKGAMSGKGNCNDSSADERFCKSIKAEPVWRQLWQTRRKVEITIFRYCNGLLQTAPQTLGHRLEINRGLRTEGCRTGPSDRTEIGASQRLRKAARGAT